MSNGILPKYPHPGSWKVHDPLHLLVAGQWYHQENLAETMAFATLGLI